MTQIQRIKILALDDLATQAMTAMKAFQDTGKSIGDTNAVKYDENMDEIVSAINTMVNVAKKVTDGMIMI